MSTDSKVATPIEGVPQVSRKDRIRFLLGFLVCGIMWVVPWAASIQVLLPQRFNDLNISNSVALVAELQSAGAIAALVANLLFGALSDRSRSKMGRRSPFMIIGSIVAGLFLYLSFLLHIPALIVLAWCGFQFGLNALLGPFFATLSDRVPEDSRALVSAVYGIGVTVGGTAGTIVGAKFIENQQIGFALGAVILALAGIAAVIIWPKEPSAEDLPKEPFSAKSLVMSFAPPREKGSSDFYRALVGRLLIMLAYYMPSGYTLYILKSYIGLSTAQAAAAIPMISIPTLIGSIVSSLIAGPISDKTGRRKPLVALCAILFAISFLFPWIWPSVTSMMISAGISGFALGIYNTCDQALNVDVLPNKEHAGKDLGILNLSNTFGQILGPIATSWVFLAVGTYKPVYIIALVIVLMSIYFIMTIKRAK